jgi:hypothetical protein
LLRSLGLPACAAPEVHLPKVMVESDYRHAQDEH